MSKVKVIVKKIPIKTNIFSFIKNINFRNYIVPKPLGRWKRDYKISNINRKIELANEDHCGVCNEYINEKLFS